MADAVAQRPENHGQASASEMRAHRASVMLVTRASEAAANVGVETDILGRFRALQAVFGVFNVGVGDPDQDADMLANYTANNILVAMAIIDAVGEKLKQPLDPAT